MNQLPIIVREIFFKNCSTKNPSTHPEFIMRKFKNTNFDVPKGKHQRNITWFRPDFNRAVTTNTVYRFLKLDQSFLYSNKINKIFNRSTVKVSYCCTQNIEMYCLVPLSKISRCKWANNFIMQL